MRDWKPEYTIALFPIAASFGISSAYFIFGGSATTAQWIAIIIFFVTLPFAVGRLIDRSK
jgi:uncharacterized membrane protein YtjA (UPF0391 family)